MLTEAQLARRLTDATRGIEAEFTIEDLMHDHRDLDAAAKRAPSRRIMAAAALCLIVGLGGALAVRVREPGPSAVGSGEWAAPITASPATPIPGSLAPHVSQAPRSVGELEASRRTGGQRTSRWTSTAVAVPVSTGFDVPITVFATDGSWSALDSAAPIVIDEQEFIGAAFGELTVLATTGDPRLVALGRLDATVLAEVLRGTETADVDGQLALRVARLPDGYIEIVAPTTLGEDPTVRRSLTNTTRSLSINEISDWASELLAAAATGSDLERRQINGRTVWIGHAAATPGAPRFLTWSPAPGVIIEIDTPDDTIPIDDLVELARDTTAMPTTEWDEFYQR